MTADFPFLFTIPHAGTAIPDGLQAAVRLDRNALSYFSDPGSRDLFHFRGGAALSLDTPVSRLLVDLNRPPYHLPPRHPDGVVKVTTVDGRPVYREGMFPDLRGIQRMMMVHYFPFHATVDQLIQEHRICLAIDCHCMLPVGLPGQKDAGEPRPHICIGNHGDLRGEARPGTLTTCPGPWVRALAERIRDTFPKGTEVSINTPYKGGFISLAHYWHTGVPWIQIEVGRALYEEPGSSPDTGAVIDQLRIREIREHLWDSLSGFWEMTGRTPSVEPQ